MSPLIWINPDDVPVIWPQIMPMIEAAMERQNVAASFGLDFVLDRLMAAEWQCWVCSEKDEIVIVYLTRVSTLPRRRVLWIETVGAKRGAFEDWEDHLDDFREFARQQDCSAICGEGRRGWAKKVTPTKTWVRYEFEV